VNYLNLSLLRRRENGWLWGSEDLF